MKQLIFGLFTFCICLLFLEASGQEFNTQLQIDSFLINNPDCTSLEQSVFIQGHDIKNLDGFKNIQFIGGNLSISSCDSLTDLSGFNKLQVIGISLNIYHCHGLKHLNTFYLLDTIKDDIQIQYNDHLQNINCFNKLSYVGGRIDITDNENLDTITCFNNICYLNNNFGRSIYIAYNNKLKYINAFNILRTANEINICYNNSLKELSGFNALRKLEEINIFRNDSLLKLNGFNKVKTVDKLYIANNKNFRKIIGLREIDCIAEFWLDNLPLLESLSCFPNLKHISSSLALKNLQSLANVECFKRIKSLKKLEMQNCPALNNFSGFDSLQVVIGKASFDTLVSPLHLSAFPRLSKIYGDLRFSFLQQPDKDLGQGFRSLDSVMGNMVFSDIESIEHIFGLQKLQYIGKSVELNHLPDLLTIDFLDKVKYLQGSLSIENTHSLQSLNGLESLKAIEGSLIIHRVPHLKNFVGFDSLSYVGNCILLDSLNSLHNFEGLSRLSSINSRFRIYHCPVLKNFDGLSELKNIDQTFELILLDSLNDITGLHKLQQLGSFRMLFCNNIKTLHGLENLSYIHDEIFLFENAVLKEISALKNIIPDSLKTVSIKQNRSLKQCAIEPFCSILEMTVPDVYLTFQVNGEGCKTNEEVSQECAITAVRPYSIKDAVFVSPNPFKNYIRLTSDTPISCLKVYSVSGQFMMQQEINSVFEYKLDCTSLPEGVYIIEIIGKNIHKRKVILKGE